MQHGQLKGVHLRGCLRVAFFKVAKELRIFFLFRNKSNIFNFLLNFSYLLLWEMEIVFNTGAGNIVI